MRINWKKVLLVTTDLLLGTYLVFAFTVFNKPDETMKVCVKTNISVDDERTGGFINANEITKRLKAVSLYPLGMRMEQVDTRKIEETLKSSAFVKTAECYKTEDGQVFISISQLMPVIRVKADNGDDYYLDDKDCIMPNSAYTSDLIIATGCISRTFAVRYLSPLAKAIMANDVWRNLIVQINVLPNGDIEMVPRIGNHVVCLGPLPEATSKGKRQQLINAFIDKKMTRLEKFYRYGLSQAGWNKYSYIDIEFDNQIICKRRPERPEDNVMTVPDTVKAPAQTGAAEPGHSASGTPEAASETPMTASNRDAQAPGKVADASNKKGEALNKKGKETLNKKGETLNKKGKQP